MLKEQFKEIKAALLTKENEDQKISIFSSYLQDPERGVHMLLAFASYNDLNLDASVEEVVNQMNKWQDCIDFEINLETLRDVAGGRIQHKATENEAIGIRDGFMHGDDRFMHGDDRFIHGDDRY